MKKSIITAIFILTILIMTNYVYADTYNSQNMIKAETMYNLGLFKGNLENSLEGFELDREMTRAEGGVMAVRLLGREKEAVNNPEISPFKDVPFWAAPHIAYLYNNKITYGTSSEKYSPDTVMPASHYMTFLLRILGYDDNEGDFYYLESLDMALQIGLVDYKEYLSLSNKFTRDDMVLLSYNALSQKIKDSEITLIQKLVETDEVVSSEAARLAGLYKPINQNYNTDNMEKTEHGLVVDSEIDLQDMLCNTISRFNDMLIIDLKSIDEDLIDNIYLYVSSAEYLTSKNTGLTNIIRSWEYSIDENTLSIYFKYYYREEQLSLLIQTAYSIINEIIEDNMSDYERVKHIYDYLKSNTEYDKEFTFEDVIHKNSNSAYGVLVDKLGVSQGFAEAMNLLFKITGLEGVLVRGEALSYNYWIPHDWNIVKIEGLFYHIDSIYDELLMKSDNLNINYDYFNITDDDIRNDHRWDELKYPYCSSNIHNYYVMNNSIANNKEEFVEHLLNAIRNNEEAISFKILNFNHEDFMDTSKIIFETQKVGQYKYITNESVGIITISEIEYL